MKVAVNNFVRRQIKNSGKTYSEDLSFEFFAKHAEEKMRTDEYEDGYRDGVCIVKLDHDFVSQVFCPYVKITDDTKLIFKICEKKARRTIVYTSTCLKWDSIEGWFCQSNLISS